MAGQPVVGVIGLGAMGLGMAGILVSKGFQVTGFDPAEERMALARKAGVTPSPAPASLFVGCDVILASLPKARDVAGVVEGANGFVLRARPGAIFVDTSTSEAATSRKLSGLCGERDIGFLDAPVSGGPAGAKAGTLTMMIGGEAKHLAKARPVIDAVASKVIHVGASGAGNVAKLVNNLFVAANLLTVAEGVRIAAKAGVPPEQLLTVVNAASGRSAVSEVNYPRWILSERFDSGFTMGLMRKDVRLARKLAEEVEALGPLSTLIADLWAKSAETLADAEDFNRITGSPKA
jgi:3-hydroxyisobutyrate dehydrogenase